uniref:Uncharacterized protein n=1 Tax=Spironucleus salmonicida TaxID=348837 RepID=V6LS19_9EUKA|eukprot:EST47370.1 Hypothetical protein SS50377_12579 [Spironucleus salmonicida]
MEANAIASDLTAEILDILCSGTSESWDLEYCIAYQTAQLALFSEGARTLLQQVRAAHQLEILDTTAPQIQSPRIVSQSTSLLLSDGYDGIQLVTAEGSVKIPDQTWAGAKRPRSRSRRLCRSFSLKASWWIARCTYALTSLSQSARNSHISG